MSTFGFRLTRVGLTGPRPIAAEVALGKGLNVIFGPSDTGKTYILQCIDFLLGASTSPKDIPEAKSYDTTNLSLTSLDGAISCELIRSLGGGDITVRENNHERVVEAKHRSGSKDTISHLLLTMSGLEGRQIKMNKDGKKRNLSFRDLARMIIVNEESVISELSPVLSGQFTKPTEEASTFRLLLTGKDDSSVIRRAPAKTALSDRAAKTQLLDELATKTRAEIEPIGVGDDIDIIRRDFDHIERSFEQMSIELGSVQQSAEGLEQRRMSAWKSLRQIESRLGVLSELQNRFELLAKQYDSDLRRLEAISEAGFRLADMKQVRCPLCGASSEHHSQEHLSISEASLAVVDACRAEMGKIKSLSSDFGETFAENAREIEALKSRKTASLQLLREAEQELKEQLEPRIQSTLNTLRELQLKRDKYRQAIGLYDRVDHLERLKSQLVPPRTRQSNESQPVLTGAHEAEEFCTDLEELLRTWKFPNLGRVTFSEVNQDVIIGGRPRSSHGKGVRAITRAAFNLTLMKYCFARSLPHPGIVVIDSPLVVYREPDADERGFPLNLKDAFYRSIAEGFSEQQVIIIENDEPPADLASQSTMVSFSGTAVGRRGFVPDKSEK